MPSTACPRSSLWIARALALPLATAILMGATAPPARAADVDATVDVAPPPAGTVALTNGKVAIDVSDADLATVLRRLGEAADFRVSTKGTLGRVSATFQGVTLEYAIRRLAQGHEIVLVYRPGVKGGPPPQLLTAQVIGPGARLSNTAVAQAGDDSGDRGEIGEIGEIARAQDSDRGVPRLGEILATSSDPVVRGRAIWGLSVLGGPAANALLSGALGDQASFVRAQAVQALRRTAGVQAVPALAGVLSHDADASVRRVAARALATLKTPEAVAALGASVEDADIMVREEVRRALDAQDLTVNRR